MTTQHRKVGDRFDHIQDPATDTGVRVLAGPNQGIGGTSAGSAAVPFRVWSLGAEDVEVRMGSDTGPIISRHVGVAAAVNYVALVPATAGGAVAVEAMGADPNIPAVLAAAGVSSVFLRSGGRGGPSGFAANGPPGSTDLVQALAGIGRATVRVIGASANAILSLCSRGTADVEVRTGGETGPIAALFRHVEAAVDRLMFKGGVAGMAPSITAQGASADIGIDLIPKGSGPVRAAGPLVADGAFSAQAGATVAGGLGADSAILTGPMLASALRRRLGPGSAYAPAVTCPYASLGIVGTPANTTPTVLASHTLPAGALDTDGQVIRARAIGTFAANASSKTVELLWGSQVIGQVGPTTANGTDWEVRVEIMRLTATTQTIRSYPRNGAVVATLINYSGTADLAAAVTLAVRCTGGGAASDVLSRGLVVEMLG